MIGVLVAAGRGRRMGGTKQLLPWPPGVGKTTLIAAAFDAVASVCDEMLVVLDHEIDAAVAALGERSFTVVPGRADGDMFESVRAGIAAALERGASEMLLQLGDHPHVAPATLDALIDPRATHPTHVIIPEHEGRGGHPIVIPSAVADRILAYRGAGGLRAFFHECPEFCRRVPVSDAGIVRDVDQPSDLGASG